MRTRITGIRKLGEEYELDLGAFELRRAGRVLRLERIPMELLILLVERSGQLVSRDEIIERIWGRDVFLGTDNSINAAIRKIRQVLRDDPERPRFIQTVTAKGYRLIAPVSDIGDGVRAAKTADAPLSSLPENLIGKKVSHYRVLQILGGGGMGVVYKAEDLRLGRSVAIKFLPAETVSDPSAFERVEKEARAASSLDHPAICTIYELGEHEGRPFIVMQLLEGQTLREWIEKPGERENPGCMAEVVRLGVQICSGLEAAHEKGIVHRDIKPSNIFVTARKEARILDFGVARLMESAVPAAATAENGRRGASMGTPAYLSPEQIRGETPDVRADLFSFGVVLYEMASGMRAFPGESNDVIEDAIVRQPLTPLRRLQPNIPSALESIVTRAVEKDRERRYQSAKEMGDDLRGLAAVLTPGQPAPLPAAVSSPTLGKKRVPIAAALAVLVIASVAGGFYYRSRLAQRLTEKDTVVIADFANSTGDAVFDDTLKQGLSSTLHQSPFLAILSDDKVSAALQQMTRPAGTALTPEVAREVCQRAGSKVYIAGAIAALGSEYVLGLRAVNCQTGDTLAREQVTVESREKVIAALGGAASSLRTQLGESLATVRKYDVPLEEATTHSLDALKAFSLAYRQANSGAYPEAIPFYQRAIGFDPEFAVAYAHMGQAYANSQQNDQAVAAIKKAFELRQRASELERFYIDTRYHELVTGDADKKIEALQLWEAMYPRDPIPHNDLGTEYSDMGRYEPALAEAEKTVELEPAGHTGYEVLGLAYIGLDRLVEARAVREKEVSLKLDYNWDHVDLYGIAFLQNDAAAMQREREWFRGNKYEARVLRTIAGFEAAQGKLQKARAAFLEAIAAAQREKLDNLARNCALDLQLADALLGPSASGAAKSPVSLDGNESASMARFFALTGKPLKAEQIAEKMLRNEPLNAHTRNIFVPSIRAEVEIAEGRPEKAVEVLQVTAPYELGWKAEYWPIFARGRALLRAGKGKDAAREFRKIIEHRGIALSGTLGPVVYALSQLEEARSLAMAGDHAAAHDAYSKFLNGWKDADADLPLLMQAKAELARISK